MTHKSAQKPAGVKHPPLRPYRSKLGNGMRAPITEGLDRYMRTVSEAAFNLKESKAKPTISLDEFLRIRNYIGQKNKPQR